MARRMYWVQRKMYQAWEDCYGTASKTVAFTIYDQQLRLYDEGVIAVGKWRVVRRTERLLVGQED